MHYLKEKGRNGWGNSSYNVIALVYVSAELIVESVGNRNSEAGRNSTQEGSNDRGGHGTLETKKGEFEIRQEKEICIEF